MDPQAVGGEGICREGGVKTGSAVHIRLLTLIITFYMNLARETQIRPNVARRRKKLYTPCQEGSLRSYKILYSFKPLLQEFRGISVVPIDNSGTCGDICRG